MAKMLSNKQIRRKAWGLACRSFPKFLAMILVFGLAVTVLMAVPAACFYFQLKIPGIVTAALVALFMPVLSAGSLKIINNIWCGKRMQLLRSLFCFTPKFLRIWGILLLVELIMIGVSLPWVIAIVALLMVNFAAIPESVIENLEATVLTYQSATDPTMVEVAAEATDVALAETVLAFVSANPGVVVAIVGVILLMLFITIYMAFRLNLSLTAFVLHPEYRAGRCIKTSMKATKRNVWRIFCHGFMLDLPVVIAEILIGAINHLSGNLENAIIVAVVAIVTMLISLLLSYYTSLGSFGLQRQLIRSQTPSKQKSLPA